MKDQCNKGRLRVCQGLAAAGVALLISASNSFAQAVVAAAAKKPALAMEAKEATLAEAKASLLAKLKELDEQFELRLEEGQAGAANALAPEAASATAPSANAVAAAAPAKPVDLSVALMQSIEGTMNPGATLVDRELNSPDLKALEKNIAANSFLVKKIEALERMLKLMEMKEEVLSGRQDFDKRLKSVQAKIEHNGRKPKNE